MIWVEAMRLLGRRRPLAQQVPTEGDALPAMAIGEKAEVTHTVKAVG